MSVLSELNVGESGVLVALDLPESVQNHLMHMGFVPDALVTALRRAPAGDPTVYGVDGMEIALRHETAEAIRVKPPVVEAAGNPEADEAVELVDSGGGIVIDSALEAESVFYRLLNDPEECRETGEASRNYVYAKKGATEKIVGYIQENRLLTN